MLIPIIFEIKIYKSGLIYSNIPCYQKEYGTIESYISYCLTK